LLSLPREGIFLAGALLRKGPGTAAIRREPNRQRPVRICDWQSSIAVERVDATAGSPSDDAASAQPVMVFPLTSDDVLSRRNASRAGIFMRGIEPG
jgi:hypothetical protein